ncbi:hypothetical protein C2G38_2235459 [Gigaspora rosea]|uniref:HAT C-terminal dimerisation domain-containing protein n=1 Tax=Gigaspora rosea TaxID=44941 RepID=A0A397TYB3_9GLOM|nr:hypothetical protein C2G38_2235459 [Gigaspora rosea]
MKKYKEYEPPFNIYWNDQDDVLIWWLTLDIQPNYLEKLAIKILNLKPHNVSSKVYPWCVSNSKKELKYFSNEITEEEIKIYDEIDYLNEADEVLTDILPENQLEIDSGFKIEEVVNEFEDNFFD